VAERRRLFTTNVILAELHALLLTRLDRFVAARVLAELDAGRVTTIGRVSARDEQRARAIIAQYTEEDFSLTAATSFAVMERLRIVRALTLDRTFAQFGWTLIVPLDQS
jgi:predicted nucleic acid-binding protein